MSARVRHERTTRAGVALVTGVLAAGSTVGMLARCSDGGQIADAGDAGADRHSFRRDGGPDVESVEAAVDAGVDAGQDACGLTSDWPGFRRLTEFDPCLSIDVLTDPDAGYNIAWTDCDAGISGCQLLVQLAPQAGTYAYATYDDAGAGNLLYLGQATGTNSNVNQYDIIDLKTSARLGEWRLDANYVNGADIVLANTTGTTTAFLGWRASGLVAEFAPAPSLFANPLTLTPYPLAPGQDINWAMSDRVVAFQPFAAPYAICRVPAGTCVPMNIASISPAVPYLTFAWHDVVFAVAEHGTTGWAQEYVIHSDGSIALLRSKPKAHIWAMKTDGATLVWKEVYGSTNFLDPQTTAEVWKAPFTTDKATLDATATKVATLPTAGLGGGPGEADVAFFNGLYSTYFGGYPYQQTIYTVDIATGQVQISPTGPGGLILGLPYVDRKELWEVTRTIKSEDYLVRIPFAQPWN